MNSESANSTPARYHGRFAPSPTGPLHFGSLIAAVGSLLQARHRGGTWSVRIEDIDPPREVAGAADAILRTLEAYGLHWDGPVIYQSANTERHRETLERLLREGVAYPCACSRKEAAAEARRRGLPPGIYPGTCRAGLPGGKPGRAVRVDTAGAEITFDDALLGPQRQHLPREVGDFVVRRADGLFSYQLAVVADDTAEGITEVVRGNDLLDSTPRQIHLQRLLGLPTPAYLHLPVAVNARGQKLSKQTGAPAVDDAVPLPVLWQVLQILRQAPPRELLEGDLAAFWRWAIAHWDPAPLTALRTVRPPGAAAGSRG